MSSTIRIKRSGVTGSPTTLAQGELAYSFLGGTQSNGGARLYIGTGSETNGEAVNIDVIGGKYFTDKLNHVPGTVIGNSAVIVDSNKSIDELLFGNNLQIDSNSISSASGNITVDPGANLLVQGDTIIDGTLSFDGASAVNETFLNQAEYTVEADQGGSRQILITSGTVTIAGGTGITSSVTGSDGSATITLDLNDTAVSAGSYGSMTKIPTFTVDAQGRLTAAGEEDVATTLSVGSDDGSASVDLLTDTFTITGGVGVDTEATGTSVTVSIGQEVYTDSNVQFADGVFDGDVTVAGDLTVNGNMTTVSSSTLEVEDSLIKLASGNTADSIDIGFYGQYGSTPVKTGFFRSNVNGEYYLFDQLDANITDTNVIDLNGLQLADFNAKDMNAANANISGTVQADLFVGVVDEIDGGEY